MSRNIVILCDGTGNEIGVTISNVLKLFRIAEKSDAQRVWYSAGVGTIGQQNPWTRLIQKARAVFGLATGLGLDDNVVGAYRFLCTHYQDGDRIFLFGFSRGAYTARALAAFVHVMGVIRPDQLNMAGYAWTAFKRASAKDRTAMAGRLRNGVAGGQVPGTSGQAGGTRAGLSPLEETWHFSRVIGGRPVPIEFVGVWDTVASVIVPRFEQLSFNLQTLRFTRANPSVKVFRQAMAIDERRRMFRLNAWADGQKFRANPFDRSADIAQDSRQMWFAGVHADIGGGYPEEEAELSKYPLAWMVEEAAAAGLMVNRAMINHLVYGKPRAGSTHRYVVPSATGRLHRSLTWAWWPLELLPRLASRRETRKRSLLGLYFPLGERRFIPAGALVHQSAEERRRADPTYRPPNWPEDPSILGDPPIAPRRRRAKAAAEKGR